MRVRGQLPAFDLLMAASHLYSIRIFVYFWAQSPVIYQMENPEHSIYMQCISGIHFNPLVFIGGSNPPNVNVCSVNTINTSVAVYQPQSFEDDEHEVNISSDELGAGRKCQHTACPLPNIEVVVSGVEMCAVLDTGAEISLISSQAAALVQEHSGVQWETLQQEIQVVGLSGSKETIQESMELNVECANGTVKVCHKVVIVSYDKLSLLYVNGEWTCCAS